MPEPQSQVPTQPAQAMPVIPTLPDPSSTPVDIYFMVGGKTKGIKLSQEDMTPESYARYEKMKNNIAGDIAPMFPIFIDNNDTSPQPNIQLGLAATTVTGEPVIVINSKEHQWSAEYVRKHLPDNAAIASLVAAGQLAEVKSMSP